MESKRDWKAADIDDRDILSLIDEHDRDHRKPFAYEVLIARGIPEKVVYAKYEKLNRRDLLDWGVSLRTAWLSPRGLEALNSSAPTSRGTRDGE